FPAGPLAGRPRVLDSPLAVTGLVVRARRQQPGQRVVSGSRSGLGLDGPEVGLLRLGVPALVLQNLAETVTGLEVPHVEVDRPLVQLDGPRERGDSARLVLEVPKATAELPERGRGTFAVGGLPIGVRGSGPVALEPANVPEVPARVGVVRIQVGRLL